MKNSLSIFILIALQHGVQAQWSAVGTGVNSSCDVLNVYNGQLIAAGRYSSLTTWNGSSWSDFDGGSAATSILVDGNEMYTGGQFTGGQFAKVIRHFNGTSWSTLGGGVDAYEIVDWNTNYKWTSIFKYNNRIYGNYNAKLVRFNTEIQEMTTVGDVVNDLGEAPTFLLYGGIVNDVTYYRSMLNEVERVVTWNDNVYDTLDMSAYPLRGIYAMTTWNGELYISGGFQNLQGELFALLKWNGSELIPALDYNPNIPLISLHATSSFLFGMYYSDGFSRIGIWNGQNFEDIAVDGGGDSMADLNGKIYAGGFFTSFAGVAVNNIAQRDFVLSTNQVSQTKTFALAPNPTINGYTTIAPAAHFRQIHIYSLAGQLIERQNLQAGESRISTDNLQAGVYVVEMTTGSEIAVSKLVVQ